MDNILSQVFIFLNPFLKKIIGNIKNQDMRLEANCLSDFKTFDLEIFKSVLESIDEEFFCSTERRQKFNAKDKRQRTYVTLLGTITLKRRIYINKHTGERFCYLDNLLKFTKRKRISVEVAEAILSDIGTYMDSYKRVADRYGVSKGAVYNIIKNLNFDAYRLTLDEKIECETLHVIADEDHVALQRREHQHSLTTRTQVKHVTIFTGIDALCKGRNQLVNRIMFSPTKDEKPDEFYQRVNRFIIENYDVKEQILCYGDGAYWIKALSENIGASFILDKFHMLQAIVKVSGGRKNSTLLKELIKLLGKNDKKEFMRLINEHLPKEQRSNSKSKQINYIKRNWTFYQKNFDIPKALYCCAEGINSHYFARYMSSRPKGFVRHNLCNIANVICLCNSKVKLKSSLIEVVTIKESQPATKGKINAIQTSLPAINSKKTELTKILKNIAHGA